MWTKTERFALWSALSVLGGMGVGGAGAVQSAVRLATAPAARVSEPAGTQDSTRVALEATRGELAVVRLQFERADAIIGYSMQYSITADLAAAIYDVALSEGVEPALAFSLVKTESNFNAAASSPAGAVGYTQILLSTARLYEPGLTKRQLFSRTTNLRLGFRYLRDLLERFEGGSDRQLELALLAYNRGPAKVQALLDAGRNPQNGYSTTVMKSYRRKS